MKEVKETLILIVEDDELSIDILAEYLRDLGFRVVTAENGMKGYIMAKDYSPDLILLDIMMPRMDGFSFLNKLTTLPKNMPVIMTTALSKKEDVTKALKLGATDYMIKPINFNTLKEKLNKHLGLSLPVEDSSKFMEIKVDIENNKVIAVKTKGYLTKEGLVDLKRKILDYAQTMFGGKAKVLFDLEDVQAETITSDTLDEIFDFYSEIKSISSMDVIILTTNSKIISQLKTHHLGKYFEVVNDKVLGINKLSK